MKPRIVKYNEDLKEDCKIVEAKFSPNIRPHKRQELCILKKKAGKINDFCKNCVFLGKSKYTCLNTNLGANGYMHNKGDGLKSMQLNPKLGIELKQPTTKIIEKGEVWTCHNAEAGARGIFRLDKNRPPCDWRIKDESKKSKSKSKKKKK